METTEATMTSSAPPTAEAPLSPWCRAIAIFSRPTEAWRGLETRAQWWFPLSIMVVCAVLLTATLHERAIMPMITERWEQMVENGQLSAEQLDRMEQGLRGPIGVALSAGQQLLAWPVIMLVLGAGISFGVGFVLGTKLRFRHAFEVINWASLVLIPSYVATWALAWFKETMQGIHLGLGILVPESDPPQRFQVALASFLDAFGPFNLWCLAVVVIGAAALSGAPRKSVAWVLGGLYAAMAVFLAAMAAMFTPAG
jgi:hypothetical protein